MLGPLTAKTPRGDSAVAGLIARTPRMIGRIPAQVTDLPNHCHVILALAFRRPMGQNDSGFHNPVLWLRPEDRPRGSRQRSVGPAMRCQTERTTTYTGL